MPSTGGVPLLVLVYSATTLVWNCLAASKAVVGVARSVEVGLGMVVGAAAIEVAGSRVVSRASAAAANNKGLFLLLFIFTTFNVSP